MLTSKELRDILNFGFEWSITQGVVSQRNNNESSISYSGLDGSIRYNEKSQLILRLEKEVDILESNFIYDKHQALFSSNSAGKIIGREKYFQLSFIDSKKRRWITSYFLLNNNIVIGHSMIIIEVLITSLDLINSRRLNNFYAYYSGELEIIPNKYTVSMNGTKQLNKYELLLKNYILRVIKVENSTILSLVCSKNNAEEGFQTYKLVREALNIVCSYPISYNIENQYDNGCLVTRIYSKRSYHRSNTSPIPSDHTDNTNIDKFISQYLKFSQTNIPPSSNALYIWWYRLYGYTLDIENKLLILSVAIESIVLKYIRKEETVNNVYDHDDIKKLGKLVKDSNASELLKKRVQKYIGNLNSSSKPIISTLSNLSDSGILLKDMNTKWQLIRNDSAHGVERSLDGENEDQMQNVIYEANYLEEVFFRLIFYVINYEGDFRQFSKFGYPLDHLEVNSNN